MKQRGFFTCSIHVWILLVCNCGVAEAEIKIGVDFGVRNDELNWSIPGEFRGQDNNVYQQNIVSELTWKDVKSNYLDAHGLFKAGQFVVRGDIGYGIINSGDNQDSDYRGNNRTEEFSRSNNKSNGDHVSDTRIGFGLNFDLMVNEVTGPVLQVTPLIGLSSHVQSLRMTNLVQTVSKLQYAPSNITVMPSLGSHPGLNSTYEARWSGPWIGIGALYRVDTQIALGAVVEHHKADYSAKANWNLRREFAHPKSYTHNATGDGNVIHLNVEMALRDQVKIVFSITSQEWTTGTGTDRFYFADGSSEYGVLNKVKWRSQAYLLGLEVPL